MDLATLDVPREEAREAFLEYRQAVREPARHRLNEATADYLELDTAVMRGYKAIASGKTVIHRAQSIAAGGTEVRTGRIWNGERVERVVPKIAVIRADARSVYTTGVRRDGSFQFCANADTWSQRKANWERFPAGTFPRDDDRPDQGGATGFRAIVPTIPPHLRPPFKLSGYHILFEAEWSNVAPVDPALLKHLGGELYAVLAVWDLTDLERAVLGGIRST